jgi:uncharacterized protein (TIGR00106 family)
LPLLEISVVPVGTNTSSFSSYVTDAVRLIEQNGLHYQITPTATVIEGEIHQLMDVATQIHQNAISQDVHRVITHIAIDDRTDKKMNILEQIEAVEE